MHVSLIGMIVFLSAYKIWEFHCFIFQTFKDVLIGIPVDVVVVKSVCLSKRYNFFDNSALHHSIVPFGSQP